MDFKDYLKLGWLITPIEKGSKAPLLKKWNDRKNLLDSEDLIKKYNGYNFGVCLGPSNIVTIDVDCVKSTRLLFEFFGIDYDSVFGNAPRIKTRENKDKYIFKNSQNLTSKKVVNWPNKDDLSKKITVIEFRAGDGCQDVLPPSIHPVTNKPYEWIVEPSIELPDLPHEIEDLWKNFDKLKPQILNACPWQKNNTQPSKGDGSFSGSISIIEKFNEAHDIESILEAHGYKKVFKNRYLSPNSTTKKPGTVILNKKWAYTSHASDSWHLKTLDAFGLFCELDCEGDETSAINKAQDILGLDLPDTSEENVNKGIEFLKIFNAEKQKRIAAEIADHIKHTREYDKSKLTTPENLIPKKGLLAKIVKYMLQSSIRRQPSLAVGASVAFLGALYGRKYASETDLRTNIYSLGLASSGSGKEHARKCLDKIAISAGINNFIGGESLTSQAAALSALQRQPTQLFKIDEFGLFLQTMTGNKSDPHKKALMSTFMSLYSSAGSIYRGIEYANQEDNKRKDIYSPNLCIYGTSTITEFCHALSSNQASNGSMARFIVFEGSSKRPKRQKPQTLEPSINLINDVKDVYNHLYSKDKKKLADMNLDGVNCQPKPYIVRQTSQVESMIDDLDDYLDQYIEMSDAAGSIYSRVVENAIKLSLIYAISINHKNPKIDSEAFEWGSSIALWSANMMMMQITNSIADSHHERMSKRVLQAIFSFGKMGIDANSLIQKTMFIDSRQRDMIVKDLIKGRMVIIKESRYVAVDAL